MSVEVLVLIYMTFPEIILIAVALGIDAFSVALATGAYLGTPSFRQKFRLCFHFGFFQFFMPVLGWYVGENIARYIDAYDHWVVLIIMLFLGGKMIFDSRKDESEKINSDITRGLKLVVLSIATSIDALSIGFGFSLMRTEIWFPSLVIGVVAAAMTYFGMIISAKASRFLGGKAELIGGLVLIAIGVKCFIEM